LEIVSFAAAVLTFILMAAMPFIIFRISNLPYEKLWNPEYYHRYAYFFCEFKLNNKVISPVTLRSTRTS
jgi:hypothetical protein